MLAIAETEATGGTRYRLLETMRQYARDRLLESGEAAQLRDLHAARFLVVAEETAPRLRSAEMIEGRRRLEIELDNIRAALEWDLDRNPEDGLRLASALEYCWVFVGRIMREGRGWLERYLQRVEPLGDDVDAAGRERVANRARALAALSQLQESLGDFEASVRLGQEAAALARRAGDEATLASALSTICDAAVFLGDYERAKQWGNEALALGRDGRYPFYLAFALTALLHCSIVGEPDEEAARGYLEALGRLSRTFENPYVQAHSRFLRGMFEARFGDPEAGVRYVREGHYLHKEMDSDLMARMTLSELATCCGDGTIAQARASSIGRRSVSGRTWARWQR
jgi:tetratricopeptide (TPR) repeat protein